MDAAAGRRVLIWPDNDEAGGKYAREVAAILTTVGCEVSLIPHCARINDPGGRGPDWTADGWDAANAFAEWSDVEAVRNAALSLAKPFVTASRMAEDAKTTADEATVERRVAELSALAEIKYVVARFCRKGTRYSRLCP